MTTSAPPATLAELRRILLDDLYRYDGRRDGTSFLKNYAFTPGYRYTVWMRFCGWLRDGSVLRRPFYVMSKAMLLRYRYKFGIAIPEQTSIGPGLYIGRFGGIMVNGDAVIGRNCNLSHGVMLGQTNRGARAGSPVVGDRVYLAPGCKVIGHVRLGDDAAVGANAVVTRDVPRSAVVAGVPAKIRSYGGSAGYVNRTV